VTGKTNPCGYWSERRDFSFGNWPDAQSSGCCGSRNIGEPHLGACRTQKYRTWSYGRLKKSKKIHRLNDREFAELEGGAEEALDHAQGKMVTLRARSVPRRQRPSGFSPTRIRSIRRRLNVSQPVFAELLYVTKATACKWEQGLRKPSGSALRLLEIAEKQPHVLVQD
jgi:putative transcriptional regulator